LGIILLKEVDTPIGTKHSLIPSYHMPYLTCKTDD
jgi:hypothetical protein